jgi:cobalt-precorrin 5A hydrolase
MNCQSYMTNLFHMSTGKQTMKKCILTITLDGYALGKDIVKKDPNYDLFTLNKYTNESHHAMNNQLRAFIKKKFKDYDCFVFIMASGIVIRLIKDLIEDKLTDPAILVMDVKGTHIISLLSGHLGKANEETIRLAQLINATPIITTASDTIETISVDLFARRHNCKIIDYEQAKKITALIVNHALVNIHSKWRIDETLPSNLSFDTSDDHYKGTILVTNKERPFQENKVRLFKKNLIVSMGCRRNISTKALIKFIKEEFFKGKLSLHSIKKIVSIDLKKNEIGFIETAKFLDVSFETIAKDKIKAIETNFLGSAFVKQSIGVSCVSEPCGAIASKNGHQLIEKKIKSGMTLSVWEEKNG